MTSPRRLARFADKHELLFEREPIVRRTPATFRKYDEQTPIGWLAVPGPTGFEVGQRIELVALHTDENTADISRLTWAAFALRIDSADGDFVLRTIMPIMPRRWHAEVAEAELVLWTRSRVRLVSEGLWSWLSRAQAALMPILAAPERVSDSAERRRRGIRLEIED